MLLVACGKICCRCAARAFGVAYLGEDHGGDLLGGESLGLAEVLNLHHGVGALLDDLEGPRLDILLDDRVIEGTTNQTPVEGGVLVSKPLHGGRPGRSEHGRLT